MSVNQETDPQMHVGVESAWHEPTANGVGLEIFQVAQNCFNCNLAFDGKFCPDCGQKRITQRLSLGRMLWDFPKTFFQLERGLFRTLRDMSVRPGFLARDYVWGRRKRYINPFTYFLIGSSVQLLSVWFSASFIRESFKKAIASASIPNREKLEKIFDGDVANGLADVYLASIAQSYTYAALLFFAVPLALSLWFFHQLFGSQYRYGEVLVFSLYVVGHLLLEQILN